MCMDRKTIAFSVLLGLVVTIATSFVYNSYVIGEFPDVRFISIPLMGIGYWGFPLPWVKQIVYPGATKEIMYLHFILDMLFWTAAVVAAKMFHVTVIKGEKLKKPKRVKKKTKRKKRPKRKTRKRKR